MDDAKEVLSRLKPWGHRGSIWSNRRGLVHVSKFQKSRAPKEQLQNLINLLTQGQHAGALSGAEKLLKQFPDSLNLYNIIGAANKGLGKLDEALEAFKKAISIKPDYADAYNNVGTVFKNQGKLLKALNCFQKAILLKSDHTSAYINMGILLRGAVFKKSNPSFQESISSLLDKKYYVRPADI